MPVQFQTHISILDKAETISVTKMFVTGAQSVTYNTDQSGAADDFTVAVAAVSLGTIVKTSVGVENFGASPTTPTDDEAYNSAKLIVFYHDTTNGRKGHYSIGARNPAAYNTTVNSKDVILTVAGGGTAAIEALVTATQALTSRDGNSVHVDRISIAGRKQSNRRPA